jgi:hypothetical protein
VSLLDENSQAYNSVAKICWRRLSKICNCSREVDICSRKERTSERKRDCPSEQCENFSYEIYKGYFLSTDDISVLSNMIFYRELEKFRAMMWR